MSGPNVYEPSFEPDREQGGFLRRRSFVGRDAGATHLGASLLELPPGRTAFPYHLHHGNEELLVVIAGQPTLRTPEGSRELEPGEVVAFARGEGGAHQVSNFSDEAVRFLIVSEMRAPDFVEYPDSGKFAARENPPGPGEPGRWLIGRVEEAVEYTDGEKPPDGPAG